MREDPHKDKPPGLGCGCNLCKQPHRFPRYQGSREHKSKPRPKPK